LLYYGVLDDDSAYAGCDMTAFTRTPILREATARRSLSDAARLQSRKKTQAF
jgi:hypothetical protein